MVKHRSKNGAFPVPLLSEVSITITDNIQIPEHHIMPNQGLVKACGMNLDLFPKQGSDTLTMIHKKWRWRTR